MEVRYLCHDCGGEWAYAEFDNVAHDNLTCPAPTCKSARVEKFIISPAMSGLDIRTTAADLIDPVPVPVPVVRQPDIVRNAALLDSDYADQLEAFLGVPI